MKKLLASGKDYEAWAAGEAVICTEIAAIEFGSI